jgi:hypothetical protein
MRNSVSGRYGHQNQLYVLELTHPMTAWWLELRFGMSIPQHLSTLWCYWSALSMLPHLLLSNCSLHSEDMEVEIRASTVMCFLHLTFFCVYRVDLYC